MCELGILALTPPFQGKISTGALKAPNIQASLESLTAILSIYSFTFVVILPMVFVTPVLHPCVRPAWCNKKMGFAQKI